LVPRKRSFLCVTINSGIKYFHLTPEEEYIPRVYGKW